MNTSRDLAHIRPIKEAIEDELLMQPGVVGVDIGYKEVGGLRTDELAIRVLVEKKQDVPPEQRIPLTIEGIKTDVIEVGRIEFHADTKRYDPLVGGCSIGVCGGDGTGTLGMIVQDRSTGHLMALSNRHVLIPSQGQPYLAVAQPSPGDQGSCVYDVIGTVYRSVLDQKVDCAVVLLDPKLRNHQCSIVELYGNRGPGKAVLGDRVKKRGRTTGLTWGDVDTIDATIKVNYDGKERKFRNQIGIVAAGPSEVFSEKGDSGSVVISSVWQMTVGLLIAGGRDDLGRMRSFANHISAVLDALNIDICVLPPKGKDKDNKDKEKERKEAMKEQEGNILGSKILLESQLLSESLSAHTTSELYAQDTGPLEERLARLEAAVGELQHFIVQADRPNLATTTTEGETESPSTETDDNS